MDKYFGRDLQELAEKVKKHEHTYYPVYNSKTNKWVGKCAYCPSIKNLGTDKRPKNLDVFKK